MHRSRLACIQLTINRLLIKCPFSVSTALIKGQIDIDWDVDSVSITAWLKISINTQPQMSLVYMIRKTKLVHHKFYCGHHNDVIIIISFCLWKPPHYPRCWTKLIVLGMLAVNTTSGLWCQWLMCPYAETVSQEVVPAVSFPWNYNLCTCTRHVHVSLCDWVSLYRERGIIIMMEELQEKYYLVSLVYKLIASLQISTDDKK